MRLLGWTIPVGNVSSERVRLLEATQQALDEGCQAISLQGGTLPITKAIDSSLRQSGFRPNRDFVGFRIGKRPHMSPMIPGSLKTKPTNSPLSESMNLVILVLAHSGDPECLVRQDGFTVASCDGSRFSSPCEDSHSDKRGHCLSEPPGLPISLGPK